MHFIEDVLRQGHVVVYDFKGQHLPDLLCDKGSGSVSLFWRNGKEHGIQSDSFHVRQYKSLSDIRETYKKYTNIQLFDGEAIKLLLAKYPYSAPYAMVRIAPRFGWLVGLPGLIRRLAIGDVRLRGIAALKTGKATQRWLVLEYLKYEYGRVTLSEELGVQAFLDYLRKERVQYVVLRFFDKLPQLDQTHDDLDLLVADEDAEKVRRFLSGYPGHIHVDVDTVSQQLYPVHLANKILKNAVDGPGGSRIPGPREAFLSFAYESLYRKGFNSGIPSRLQGTEIPPDVSNDYAPILAQMAKKLNIQVPIDMESLDEYLHQEGWRPALGNYARHTRRNEWVQRRLLSHHQHTGIDLGVLILKEKAVRLGLVDRIIEEIERQGFTILHSKTFDEDGKRIAMDKLRGGNWESASGDTPPDFAPAVAVVVLDTLPYSVFHAKRGLGESRVRPLKTELRKRFDDENSSLVHSTNDTLEAWEYIEVCCPEEVEAIQEKINEYFFNHHVSLVERFRFSIQRTLAPRNLRQISQRLLLRLLVN